MKHILISLLFITPVLAQEGIPGPFADLNDSQWVEDQQVDAFIDRAARENYWGDVDEANGAERRFGPVIPLTFYVDKFYEAKAREHAEKEMGNMSEMLNESIAREENIRAQLLDRQGHYNFAVKTINEQFIRLWMFDSVLAKCKKTRGRDCKY